MKANKNQHLDRFNLALSILLGIALFGFVLVMVTYFVNFNDEFGSQEVFGQFGDFIGGVLNPIFSFITICLLIVSLAMQRKELNKVVEELELAREVHISSVNMKHYEYLLELLKNDSSEFKLAASTFAQKMDEIVRVKLPNGQILEWSLFEILSESKNLEAAKANGFEVITPVSPGKNAIKYRPIDEKFQQLNEQLVTLSTWIKKVETLGCPSWRAKDVLDVGTDILMDYYNTRAAQLRANVELYLPAFNEFRKIVTSYPAG